MPIRSDKFVFVSFCTLAQGVRAQGIVRDFPSIITPVVKLLEEHHINIVQMPCPELFFDGWVRNPCRKEKYNNPKNRDICRRLGKTIVNMAKMCSANNAQICCILGIERSPSCAVKMLSAPPPNWTTGGTGIFTEELQRLFNEENMSIPFVGIDVLDMNGTLAKIRNLIEMTK